MHALGFSIGLARREGKRRWFVLAGSISVVDWLGAYEAALSADPGCHVLWDLSKGCLAQISSVDARDFAHHIGQVRGRVRGSGRFAIACTGDADYGVARMLSIYAGCSDPPNEIEVFRDADAAWWWLSGPGRTADD